MLGGKWGALVWPATTEAEHDPDTGLPIERLVQVAKASVTLPESFVSVVMAFATKSTTQD